MERGIGCPNRRDGVRLSICAGYERPFWTGDSVSPGTLQARGIISDGRSVPHGSKPVEAPR